MAQSSPPLPEPSPVSGGTERRTLVRYARSRRAGWQVPVTVGENVYVAQVRDLSTMGIGLILPEHLEPGTLLTAELTNASWLFSCTQPMCVVHVRSDIPGQYVVGCRFATPLTYEQVYALIYR